MQEGQSQLCRRTQCYSRASIQSRAHQSTKEIEALLFSSVTACSFLRLGSSVAHGHPDTLKCPNGCPGKARTCDCFTCWQSQGLFIEADSTYTEVGPPFSLRFPHSFILAKYGGTCAANALTLAASPPGWRLCLRHPS